MYMFCSVLFTRSSLLSKYMFCSVFFTRSPLLSIHHLWLGRKLLCLLNLLLSQFGDRTFISTLYNTFQKGLNSKSIAATLYRPWHNRTFKNTQGFAYIEDSDQFVHPSSKIKAFAVHTKKLFVIDYP